MKINISRRKLDYGEFQAGRVVWFYLKDDSVSVKLNVLDKAGVILYQVAASYQEGSYEVTKGYMTDEQLKTILELTVQLEPDMDWEEAEDEEAMLMVFGVLLAERQEIERFSKRTDQLVVDYLFKSYREEEEEHFETAYFKKAVNENAILTSYITPRLIKRKEFDAVEVHIAKAGVAHSFRVEKEIIRD